MKTSKRIFALLVTAVMILSLVPATSFAAAGDLTKFTVSAENGTGTIADYTIPAGAKGISDANLAKTLADYKNVATMTVYVKPEVLATIDGSPTFASVVTPNESTVKYLKETSDTVALSTINGGADSITSVKPGDVIWVLDAATGNNNVARLVISTPNVGTIEGEGAPQEVAFDVVVPMSVDFVLDPGELNIEGNQIFGYDYTVYNKTPGYGVDVEFSVTNKAGTGIEIVAPNPTWSGTARQAQMNVVNAADLTLSGDTVSAVNYISTETGAEAKRLDTERRTVALSAVAANSSGTPVKTNFVLAPYSSALALTNVSAFTFRGNLNPGADTAYASGDIDVTVAYTLTGVGTEKYTKEAPALVGNGAKAFAVTGYGFVNTANAPIAGAQNTKWLNPDNGNVYEGHTTLTYTAAQAAGNVYIGMDLPAGTTVSNIYFGEVGASMAEFSDQTAAFDLTGVTAATRIKLDPGWSGAATNRTFEFYIVLSNGEAWAVTVNANA